MSGEGAIFNKIKPDNTEATERDLIPAKLTPTGRAGLSINTSDSEGEESSSSSKQQPTYAGRGTIQKGGSTKSPTWGSGYVSAYSQHSLAGKNMPPVKTTGDKHWADGDSPYTQKQACHECPKILGILEAMKHDNKSLRNEIKALSLSIAEMRTELHCLKESSARFPTTSAASTITKTVRAPRYDDGIV